MEVAAPWSKLEALYDVGLAIASTLDELGSAEAREHVHGNARRIANSLLNWILIQREGGLGLRADQELA